jgi:hypothetical protein
MVFALYKVKTFRMTHRDGERQSPLHATAEGAGSLFQSGATKLHSIGKHVNAATALGAHSGVWRVRRGKPSEGDE